MLLFDDRTTLFHLIVTIVTCDTQIPKQIYIKLTWFLHGYGQTYVVIQFNVI